MIFLKFAIRYIVNFLLNFVQFDEYFENIIFCLTVYKNYVKLRKSKFEIMKNLISLTKNLARIGLSLCE